MAIYYGVVKGNRVLLASDARLADGTQVEVRPRQASDLAVAEDEERVKARLRAEGILASASLLPLSEDEDDFEPIEVEGDLLSRAIIRDRR